MNAPLAQHAVEIQANRRSWENKPLLQAIYGGFYRRILDCVDPRLPGRVVEIGSGIGNLKAHLPEAIRTDLFPHPWLDVVCDGYELPFASSSVSHLVLFDVFHHLQFPRAFLNAARRVLTDGGRLLVFEPYLSLASYPVYGWLHHEPVAWRKTIDLAETRANPWGYYAAQGNATRLFFRSAPLGWLEGWRIFHAEAFSSFSYLLSGGYSKPACYPAAWLPRLERWDRVLSRWPRWFGARCLVGLTPIRMNNK